MGDRNAAPEFRVCGQCYLNDLVDNIRVAFKFDKRDLEQVKLQRSIHAFRAVETNKTGVDGNAGILSLRPRIVSSSTKINRVFRYKRPVAIKDEWLELPVLPATLSQANNVRGLHISPLDSQIHKLEAQTLINQKFHAEAALRVTL